MKRVNAILAHPLYQKCYRRLEMLERDRIFCCHQMAHLMDVARIAYITCLEQDMGIRKDVIYGAALLHDIGKFDQYEEGIPHEISGEKIASEILDSLPEDCAYSEEEKRLILTGIRGHWKLRDQAEPFERLLYTSDKASRMCFACPPASECDWSDEKKNLEILV